MPMDMSADNLAMLDSDEFGDTTSIGADVVSYKATYLNVGRI